MKVNLRICIFILAAISYQISSAQYFRLSYHKKDGSEVTAKEDSYFYRIIANDPEDPKLFKYIELYSKGDQPKLTSKIKSPSAKNTKVGEYLTYHPNGNIYQRQAFDANHTPIDTAYTYYANGILFMKTMLDRSTYKRNSKQQEKSLMSTIHEGQTIYLLVQDSLGNKLAENGEGTLIIKDLLYQRTSETGPISKHKKHGIWNGVSPHSIFTETWEEGKFIRGIATDPMDQQTEYTPETYNVAPEYPGGIDELRSFVNRNFRFPEQATRARVSGTVRISFVVDKDGSMTDFKVDQDLGYGTGHAGIEALQQAKRKWKPGMQRGIPVRVAYSLPITLSLN